MSVDSLLVEGCNFAAVDDELATRFLGLPIELAVCAVVPTDKARKAFHTNASHRFKPKPACHGNASMSYLQEKIISASLSYRCAVVPHRKYKTPTPAS